MVLQTAFDVRMLLTVIGLLALLAFWGFIIALGAQR